MVYRVFSAGQYKIRQRGNRYYVYKIEKDNEGNRRDHYVGPLDKVVKITLGVLGGVPPKWTGRDLNPGPLGCQPSTLPG